MKRISLLVLVALLAVTCVFAGGQTEGTTSTTKTSGQKTITFFHRWPNEPKNSYFNDLVARYEKLHPEIKIQMDYVLNDSYKEKIRAQVASGDLPDVFCTWSDSFARNLVASGNVRPLDDIMAADKAWSSRVFTSQLKGFTFDGKTYAMPMMVDAKVFIYNKSVFEKYNLTPPTTYDELIKILDTLKANGYEHPLIEGIMDAWAVSHYLGPIFYNCVPEETSLKDYDPATGEFTDSGYIQGYEVFKKLMSYGGDLATSIKHEEARNMFCSGEVPILFCETAEYKLIKNNNAPEFGTFGFPSITEGKGKPGVLEGAPEGWALSKNASPEAIEFFKWILNDENMIKWTKDTGEASPYNGTVNSSNASQETIGAVELIKNTKQMIPWFDNAVDLSVGDLFMRGGQAIVTGSSTPEEVMKQVQDAATKLRAKSTK